MTRILFKLSFLTLFVYAALPASAQRRYFDMIITVNGDSIKCSIDPEPLSGPVKYQTPDMKKPEPISSKYIKEYFASGFTVDRKVVYVDSSKTPEFMRVLEKGKLSLYQIIVSSSNGTSAKAWYAGKGNSDQVISVKEPGLYIGIGKSRAERKNNFGEMLKDNPGVYNKYITEKKFSYKQLRNLVHLYNTGQEFKEE
ncbi:MAG: hypothetical protein V4577_02045 [Bacteroidota bacterium]